MLLPVQSEWKDLGLQLGVPMLTLSAIQSSHAGHHHASENCLTDMFDWWLKNDKDAAYEKLVQSLIAVERSDVAESIGTKHSKYT